MSRWNRTVYIPWLVSSYDTHNGKRWLNSNLPRHSRKMYSFFLVSKMHVVFWQNKRLLLLFFLLLFIFLFIKKNHTSLARARASHPSGRYSPKQWIPWVAAQAVRWSGIPKVARSRFAHCSKYCDLQPSPALQCAIRGAQGVLPFVGWGVQLVNWIYRLLHHCPYSWFWLTATRSSPLGYFSKLLQVVDNWTHILL